MSITSFNALHKWLKGAGVKTLSDLAVFVRAYTDGTPRDILNKAHGCYIYQCL